MTQNVEAILTRDVHALNGVAFGRRDVQVLQFAVDAQGDDLAATLVQRFSRGPLLDRGG